MRIRKIVGVLLPIIAGVLAVWFYHRTDHHNQDSLILYGNIDIRQVDLSFQDPEHIDRVLVQEGARVAQGQLLAIQDLERFQFAADSAEARVEAQQQVLKRLLNGSRAEEIAKARADVKAAEAEVVFAKKVLARTRTLALKKLASMEDADRARSELDSAKEKLKALNELLALAVIGPRPEDIEEARAKLKAEQSALMLARTIWEDAHLYAPHDGIIQDRMLEAGDMASAETPVFSLALTDPVWARVYVQESDLGKLRHGMVAHISSDSFPGQQYQGWVGYISPTSEFTPKAVETTELRTSLVYQVRVYACNPQEHLRLGMPVTVTIDLAHSALSDQPSCGLQ
ncbi:MAG: efflux RND transporter periplasmic adaptor subunit [Gammaproteobacteria bacterium]